MAYFLVDYKRDESDPFFLMTASQDKGERSGGVAEPGRARSGIIIERPLKAIINLLLSETT